MDPRAQAMIFLKEMKDTISGAQQSLDIIEENYLMRKPSKQQNMNIFGRN